MIYALILSIFILFIFMGLFIKWKNRFKRLEKEYISEQNIGYYLDQFTFQDRDKINIKIYVKELDKYSNGDSNIELYKIEVLDGPYKVREAVHEVATDQFSTTKKKTDIVWLKSEDSIRLLRKKKLESIKKKKL